MSATCLCCRRSQAPPSCWGSITATVSVGASRARTALLAAVSLAWVLAVELTPQSQRPYVGGTTDNSELSLSFGHNGLGRVLGQRNAPGHLVIPARRHRHQSLQPG